MSNRPSLYLILSISNRPPNCSYFNWIIPLIYENSMINLMFDTVLSLIFSLSGRFVILLKSVQ